MNSELARRLIPEMIEEIRAMNEQQNKINDMYLRVVDLILTEAEESLKTCKGKKRARTKYKEYWNSELTKRWHVTHEAERVYKLYCHKKRAPGLCQEKKAEYRRAQELFDKYLKWQK